jgi:hypothetical protein
MRCTLLIPALVFTASTALADVPRYIGAGGLSFGLIQGPRMPQGIGVTAFGGAPPGLQCREAVQTAGRKASIPDHLMSAIARVESGRANGQGEVDPWPWSINVEGIDHIYDTKAEVIAAVQAFQARGIRSIDVGCMQVNLMYHPEAFASLDQAFDPFINATYAAGFLQRLFAQTGSWPAATAAYHSAVAELGQPYQRKVQAVLPEEQRRDEVTAGRPVMTAMNAIPGPGAALAVGGGVGAIMLNHNAQAARLLPMVPGTPVRGLDAYRAAPVPISVRVALTTRP